MSSSSPITRRILPFFGELNANLAIRAGAVGAIIDGVTRDTRDTVGMGFPVFAKGHYCKDTRKRGVVTSRNRTVLIDDISIHKDDLIFGDTDGIVIIPKQHGEEKAVLARSVEAPQELNRPFCSRLRKEWRDEPVGEGIWDVLIRQLPSFQMRPNICLGDQIISC